MRFKREWSAGDLLGLLGFGLAIASFVVAQGASRQAADAERARSAPSTFLSSLVTVGGPRSDSPGIEAASAKKLKQLSAQGVRGLPFPEALVVEVDPRYAALNLETGQLPRRVRGAYQWLLIEVNSGDCIRLTRLAYKVTTTISTGTADRPRRIDREVSDPYGNDFICADQGLLVPIGMFTVSADPGGRKFGGDLAPYECLIEYRSKTEDALTKERCDDSFTQPVGLG